MPYSTRPLPDRAEDLIAYLRQEFETLEQAINAPVPIVQLQVAHRSPEKLREGMIVLADGIDWNPGSGRGFYGYHDGAWHYLG